MSETAHPPHRYIVIGAGAIGCATAALLHEAGRAVTIVARGETLEALRHGIDLRTPTGARRVVVEAVPTAQDASPGARDLVVLAVMGQHTEDAIRAVPPSVPVLSFQNGTAPLDVLADRSHPTFAGMLYVPAERRGPGVVALVGHPDPGVVMVGPWRNVPDRLGGWPVEVARALTTAGLRASAEADIAPWVRAKQLLNVGGIVVALCDSPPGELIAEAQAEASAVFAAAGHEVIGQGAFVAAMGSLTTVPVDGRVRIGGSTRGALARGEPLETSTINGSVVHLGLTLNVPTPINEALVALSVWAVRERVPAGSMSPDALQRWCGRPR